MDRRDREVKDAKQPRGFDYDNLSEEHRDDLAKRLARQMEPSGSRRDMLKLGAAGLLGAAAGGGSYASMTQTASAATTGSVGTATDPVDVYAGSVDVNNDFADEVIVKPSDGWSAVESLAAQNTNSDGWTHIRLLEGDYDISSTVTWDQEYRTVITGHNSRVIHSSGSPANALDNNGLYLIFRDIEFDGNSQTNDFWFADNSTTPGNRDTVFRNCTFRNSSNSHIHFKNTNVDGLICDSCEFVNNGTAVRLNRSGPLNRLRNCHWHGTGQTAVKTLAGDVRIHGGRIIVTGSGEGIVADDLEGATSYQGGILHMIGTHVEGDFNGVPVRVGNGSSGYSWGDVRIERCFFNDKNAASHPYVINLVYVNNSASSKVGNATIKDNRFRANLPTTAWVGTNIVNSVRLRGNNFIDGIPLVDVDTESDVGIDCIVERDQQPTSFSGDGTTTSFAVAHNLRYQPTKQSEIVADVYPLSYDAEVAAIKQAYASDDNSDGNFENITVEFETAPISGTDNVSVMIEPRLIR